MSAIGRPGVRLFLTTFVFLYAELLCIRWIPAYVRFVAYFTNFILLASFLGLGAGILSARRGGCAWGWGPSPGCCWRWWSWWRRRASSCASSSPECSTTAPARAGRRRPENALVLPAAFLLVALLFACLGRPIGRLLTRGAGRHCGPTPWTSAAAWPGSPRSSCSPSPSSPPAVWFGGLAAGRAAAGRAPSARRLLRRGAPAGRARHRHCDRPGELVVAVLPGGPDADGRSTPTPGC